MITFIRLVDVLVNFYEILIVVWCLLSWVPMREGGLLHDIACVLQSIVGPYINIFRKYLPPMAGMDFSPVVAVIALNLLETLVIRILL